MEKLIFLDVEEKWKLFLSLSLLLYCPRGEWYWILMALNVTNSLKARENRVLRVKSTLLWNFQKELYDVNLIEAEHLKRLFFWSSRHHFLSCYGRENFSLEQLVCERACMYISHDVQDTVECHQISQNVINLGMIFELSANSWSF